MTAVSAPVYGTQVCEHVPAAVCFLCSDQDPRWKSWRIGMGLPEEPPNAVVRVEMAAEVARLDEIVPVPAVVEERVIPVAAARRMLPIAAEAGRKYIASDVAAKAFNVPSTTKVYVDEDEVYTYWNEHPKMTFFEAERALRREKAAVIKVAS